MKKKNLSLDSNAKINLYLEVLDKRPDGYHNIRTIFHEITLADRLNFTLTKKDGIEILTSKPFVSLEKNLIYKVAIFMKKNYNVLNGVSVELEKNIPISAGLGGGSSNAAATILALSKLWDLNLSRADMHEIALKFGSDINFFLAGGTAIGRGRGEKIESIDDIDIDNIFLVKPDFGISAKEAYDEVELTDVYNTQFDDLLSTKDATFYYNHLEYGVKKIYSEIDSIISQIMLLGASKSMLSGSGSAIIGFCPNRQIAENLSKHYSKKGYWNCITKSKKRSTL